MSEQGGTLDGPTRAAVLLMAVGESQAAEVLRHMEPNEVQRIGAAMAAIKTLTQDRIGEVLDEFVSSVGNQSSLGLGSREYLKNVLDKTLGEDMAGSVLPSIVESADSKSLETLKWMEPSAIANILRKEHPQLIAIVLVSLESEPAGHVLGLLPEALQTDVMLRIATLDGVHSSALEELDELMGREFKGNTEIKISGLGGVKAVAGILNHTSPEAEEAIIKKLEEELPEVGEQIQAHMFTFDNLMELDDRSIQTLLREVQSEVLTLALRGAAPSAQTKVFRNMSSRAAELLKDDLESRGPVRLSEVEGAQKSIIDIARQMAEEERLVLPGKGEALV